MCAAPTVLVALANSADQSHRSDRRQGLRVLTGGAPPAPATIERLESQLGWEVIHV
jgi:fatty-acyl-CoA synthase